MLHRVRRYRTWATLVVVFAVGVALLSWLNVDPNLIAGVAGAVAAAAAWQAARESSAAAREARDALGYAMRPTLEGSIRNRVNLHVGGNAPRLVAIATITNTSPWPATSITVDVVLPNGTDQVIQKERMDGSRAGEFPAATSRGLLPGRSFGSVPHEVQFDLGDVTREPGGLDGLTLRFADDRGLMRWEVKHTWERGAHGGNWPTLTPQRRVE